MGLEPHCILDTVNERSPSFSCLIISLPYLSLSRKRYPFTAGLTQRVFQSSDGEAQPRTHDLTSTFCTITEPTSPLYYGASLLQAGKSLFTSFWMSILSVFIDKNRTKLCSVFVQLKCTCIHLYDSTVTCPSLNHGHAFSRLNGKRPWIHILTGRCVHFSNFITRTTTNIKTLL